MIDNFTIKKNRFNNSNLELYIDSIIKSIFNDKIKYINKYEEDNIYEVGTYKNGKVIVVLPKIIDLFDNKLRIVNNNKMYEYGIDIDKQFININLREINFGNNDNNYHVTFIGSSRLVNINNIDSACQFEIDEFDIDNKKLLDTITFVKADDRLEDIYTKTEGLFTSPINEYNSVRIKKCKKINSLYNNERVTDMISLYNGKLVEFMTTVNKNNRTYIIRKDNDNYNITFVDVINKGMSNFYFDINNEVKLIKKLEKKD